MIELLRTRRSIRAFQDRPVSPEHIALLEEALLRAPSSRNSRPWRFVLVQDAATREALAKAKPGGAKFLADAPLNVVICGDPELSDVYVEDCSIAAIVVQLQAHAMGLGSCWAQIRNRRHDAKGDASSWVLRQLRLPTRLEVVAIVGIGYPAESKPGWAATDLSPEKIDRLKR
jgi:nitroreductase